MIFSKLLLFIIFIIFIIVNNNVVAELPDEDMDGIFTEIDNCPNHANRFQSDFDNDGIGDVCDEDTLANKQVPLIYEGIPLKPIPIQASLPDGIGSCQSHNPIIQKILVPRLTKFDQYSIISVKFGFTAVHEFRGDLRVTIESPQGTRIKVIDDDGGGEFPAFDVYLDDSILTSNFIHNEITDNAALPFYDRFVAPFQPLSGFSGESPFGVWKIEICDAFDIKDDGEFIGATLILREGTNTDGDSEDNVNDCAKLDQNIWQLKKVYFDEDADGYGTGETFEKCIGSIPPINYSIKGNDNCPLISNPDQNDENNDGKGDPCDAAAFQVVKRGEIAKPIMQKVYGKQYQPPVASGKKYIDVQIDGFHANWIEDFTSQKHNLNEECTKNRYCPNQVITVDQLVKILIKVKTSINSTTNIKKFKEQIEVIINHEVCEIDNYCSSEAMTVEVFEKILNTLF